MERKKPGDENNEEYRRSLEEWLYQEDTMSGGLNSMMNRNEKELQEKIKQILADVNEKEPRK